MNLLLVALGLFSLMLLLEGHFRLRSVLARRPLPPAVPRSARWCFPSRRW